MTSPLAEVLEQFSKAELIALVVQLQERLATLEAEVAQLRHPPTNSRNSSQPPSRDQKANALLARRRKKHGPPTGHARSVRPLVEQPDRVIVAPVTTCQHCAAVLPANAAGEFVRRQITELPRLQPVVIETQQQVVVCPHCQSTNRGALPAGLEAERQIGPQLSATIVYLKHTQHLSYERIVATLRELYGLSLSEGCVGKVLQRAGQAAQPRAAQIKTAVLESAVVQSDETSARLQGRNWWQWVVRSATGVYHCIVPRRNAAVLTELLGEVRVPVWVCDTYGAQLQAAADAFQLCLAHQLRALQAVAEAAPQEPWAHALQQFFSRAIDLHHRFHAVDSKLTINGYVRRVFQLEAELDARLATPVRSAGAQRLQARFVKHRDKLLTFLHYDGVPPTNNASEQALRPSVIHRKVTNGFRSEWGARTYAALESVLATAKQRGEKLWDVLLSLMGAPVLPFLEA